MALVINNFVVIYSYCDQQRLQIKDKRLYRYIIFFTVSKVELLFGKKSMKTKLFTSIKPAGNDIKFSSSSSGVCVFSSSFFQHFSFPVMVRVRYLDAPLHWWQMDPTLPLFLEVAQAFVVLAVHHLF